MTYPPGIKQKCLFNKIDPEVVQEAITLENFVDLQWSFCISFKIDDRYHCLQKRLYFILHLPRSYDFGDQDGQTQYPVFRVVYIEQLSIADTRSYEFSSHNFNLV